MVQHRSLLAVGLSLGLCGCGEDPGPDGRMEPPPPPFAAVAPESYTAKVKTLLTGQPVSAEELRQVQGDPAALAGLIDRWMEQPEFRDKTLAFFRNAFQQGQLSADDLIDQLPERLLGSPALNALLLANLQDSFPRTAWDLVTEGRPLNEAITTRAFQLTPPLMALLAYLDDAHVDDAGRRVSRLRQQDPKWAFQATNAAVPLSATLDPKSPNYMKWQTPIALPMGCTFAQTPFALFTLIFGGLITSGPSCNNVYRGDGLFTEADFGAWRTVTIRAPRAGEAVTSFYDLPALRSAKELVLRVPRIGFFSTPAFFANWPTNSSNEARVTINQALIVALGASFDDSNVVVPVSEVSLSREHAQPGTPCYSCHRTLDPMRQFFRQAYTLAYHEQTDPKQASVHGVFAYGGVSVQGHGLMDLAQNLAQHERFAAAWTQKLCYYANSAPCIEADPEFQRVTAAFQQSGLRWKALVRALYASPLTTHAASTVTAEQLGEVVNISRTDHLCVALSRRLGVADICGLSALRPSAAQQAARRLAGNLPADGYSRGAEAPVLANSPTLFFRGGTENLCRTLADQVVGAMGRYRADKPEEAIADLVQGLMGLSAADARAEEAKAVLREHFAFAQKQKDATTALKSTFMLACQAPTSVGIGL